jgi:hypothetical protein
MARLTITLSDQTHAAVKEAAGRRSTTIGRLIEQSLEAYGVKTTRKAADVVAAARSRSRLTDGEAAHLAVQETRAARRRRR